MRLWFVRDVWRYTNVFWLIDWLVEISAVIKNTSAFQQNKSIVIGLWEMLHFFLQTWKSAHNILFVNLHLSKIKCLSTAGRNADENEIIGRKFGRNSWFLDRRKMIFWRIVVCLPVTGALGSVQEAHTVYGHCQQYEGSCSDHGHLASTDLNHVTATAYQHPVDHRRMELQHIITCLATETKTVI